MALPQRIRAGCDAATFFRGARWDDLCHSAFVRVATQMRELTVPLLHLCHSAFVRVATHCYKLCKIGQTLCLSAFARVATLRPFSAAHGGTIFATAHSRGLRRCDLFPRRTVGRSLPQRIRAGCDASDIADYILSELCHSAFARVATALAAGCRLRYVLCHSAFARVATPRTSPHQQQLLLCHSAFARVATVQKFLDFIKALCTLPQRIRAGCDNSEIQFNAKVSALPQRIRAGCDLFQAHYNIYNILCHSAFARVATAEKQCSALRICCEKVDSFSSVGESGLALTIFPFSFAAKATYVAINDSFGRAIDRFFGANRTGISVNYDFAEHPCL